MMEINEEMYQRAKARAILLLTIGLSPDEQTLIPVALQEYHEMLPSVDIASKEFAGVAALITTLVSWLCGQIEGDAEKAGRTPLEELADFAEFLRGT